MNPKSNRCLGQEKITFGVDLNYSSRKIRKNYSPRPLPSLYRLSRLTINRKEIAAILHDGSLAWLCFKIDWQCWKSNALNVNLPKSWCSHLSFWKPIRREHKEKIHIFHIYLYTWKIHIKYKRYIIRFINEYYISTYVIDIPLTAFHLTLATFLQLFHHCCLSNVKQGQIDDRERCERQLERTFYKHSFYNSFIINLIDREHKFFLLQNVAMKHFVNYLSTVILSLKKQLFLN